MKNKSIFIVFLVGFIVLPLTGCFSAKEENLKAFKYPNEALVTMDSYDLLPPDEITVICSSVPELAGAQVSFGVGQTQVIRPDGVISFERVGEISVAGKTPRQVAELIAQRVSSMYKLAGDNPVEVRVKNQSHFYYMVGMVQDPGAKFFSGRETTLSALTKAVPTNLAWKDQIQVIRPSSPNEPSKVFRLDYRELVERGGMRKNVLLQEGDIIYVPPTILASIGMTVSEIVSPIMQGSSAVSAMTPAQQ